MFMQQHNFSPVWTPLLLPNCLSVLWSAKTKASSLCDLLTAPEHNKQHIMLRNTAQTKVHHSMSENHPTVRRIVGFGGFLSFSSRI